MIPIRLLDLLELSVHTYGANQSLMPENEIDWDYLLFCSDIERDTKTYERLPKIQQEYIKDDN